jgi:DNA-binding response OmpR family regulator
MTAKKVLVVDDEPAFCEVIRDALQSEGFQVCVATSGDEALLAYKRGKHGTVLLDVRMPGKDGLEVIRELKALDPKACVIMVTATHQKETIERFRAEGAFSYLTKPLEFTSLLGLLTMREQLGSYSTA